MKNWFLGNFKVFNKREIKKKIGFVSPELIPAIKNKNILEIKENFYKADVFALGLCLLEAATLRKSTDIYDT